MPQTKGMTGKKHTQAWKELMSKKMSGRIMSESHKQKISFALMGRTPKSAWKKGNQPWNLGVGNGWIDHRGYRVISISGKHILEHNHIWCSQKDNLNYIPKGFVIHHIDCNKLNNLPSNLFLIQKSEHSRLHHTKLGVN